MELWAGQFLQQRENTEFAQMANVQHHILANNSDWQSVTTIISMC